MESLKINYIMYGTGRTGGTRVLFNFMNELSKRGHEISITTLSYDPWFPLSDGIRIITKRTKFDLYYFYTMQKIRHNNMIPRRVSFINKLMQITPKVDVNVATFSPTAYVASWKSIDGSTPFYHMQHFETIMFKDPLEKKFIADTYFLPIYKVANSIWLRDRLYEFTGKRYSIVNPAIEHDIFYKRNENKHDGKNRIDIVALGKGGWKNSAGIYDAVKKVRSEEKSKKIVLHFFGHRPPENIGFDGEITIFHKDPSDEDLAILYSNSDIQITFSKAESFPLPPLEAMACGSVVITTPHGTEDYAVNRENVIIVEPDNIDMLANSIKKLIRDEDLMNKLKENGMKTAKRFGYSSQAKILEQEIKKSIDENTSNDWRLKII